MPTTRPATTVALAVLAAIALLVQLVPAGAVPAGEGVDADATARAAALRGVASDPSGTTGTASPTAAGPRIDDEAATWSATRFAQADQCRIDPVGDVQPPHPLAPQADIVRFCGPTAGTLEFTLDLVGVPDPAGDPNWQHGLTGWLVGFDVGFDGWLDYDMLFWNDGTGPVVTVLRYADDHLTCTAPARFEGTRLSTTLAMSCLDHPAGFAYAAAMLYDSRWDDPHAPVLFDDMTNSSAEDPAPAPPPPAPSPPPPAPSPPPPGPVADEPGPGPAPSAPARATARLEGPSRIETSIEISRYQFPDGAEEVYLSRSDEFADSISSGSLTRGPILLVPRCGPVPAAVLEEVRRLGADRVVALGGDAAVCDQVLADVASA